VKNAKNLAVYGKLVANPGSELLTGWTPADVSLSLSDPVDCKSSTLTLCIIRLSANVPFSGTMWQAIGLPSTITLVVQHEERWIGQ
jgi:hypothetical protein